MFRETQRSAYNAPPEPIAKNVEAYRTQTRAQILLDRYDNVRHEYRGDYEKARKMREDSTISIARDLILSMVGLEPWTVKGDNDFVNQCLRYYVLPLRQPILDYAAYGQIDFGWKAFETVWAIHETEQFGVRFVPVYVKPLLNDFTYQRRDIETGEYVGLRHDDVETGTSYYIDAWHSIFINFDDEGVGKYGRAMLKRSEIPFDCWNDSNDGACRYDKKIAGCYLILEYPPGSTLYNGVETDNADIARDILDSLQASGQVAIPRKVVETIQNLNEDSQIYGWSFKLLESPGSTGAMFNERMRYLDSLKVRGLGVTERALLEGQFGTKAEAGEHADLTMAIAHLRHSRIVNCLNEQLVQLFLEVNFGVDYKHISSISIPSPDQAKIARLQTLYTQILSDPVILEEELLSIDRDAMRELLDIPSNIQDEQEQEETREDENQLDQLDRQQQQKQAQQQQQIKEQPKQLSFSDDCGANAEGGGGFQKGNTCGGGKSKGSSEAKSKRGRKKKRPPLVVDFRDGVRESTKELFSKIASNFSIDTTKEKVEIHPQNADLGTFELEGQTFAYGGKYNSQNYTTIAQDYHSVISHELGHAEFYNALDAAQEYTNRQLDGYKPEEILDYFAYTPRLRVRNPSNPGEKLFNLVKDFEDSVQTADDHPTTYSQSWLKSWSWDYARAPSKKYKYVDMSSTDKQTHEIENAISVPRHVNEAYAEFCAAVTMDKLQRGAEFKTHTPFSKSGSKRSREAFKALRKGIAEFQKWDEE